MMKAVVPPASAKTPGYCRRKRIVQKESSIMTTKRTAGGVLYIERKGERIRLDQSIFTVSHAKGDRMTKHLNGLPQNGISRNNMSRTGNARRTLLKGLALGLFSAAFGRAFRVSSAHAAPLRAGEGKTLLVYYSRSGNTRKVAGYIQEALQADVVELQTATPYPEEYRATTRQAKEELESGYLPPLRATIPGINDYDAVIIGSPNWWGTMAMPVRTFLSEYDLSGKTLALFITHEGSRLGRSMDDLRGFCPRSTILEGLAVRGGDVDSAQGDVTRWLKDIGLASK